MRIQALKNKKIFAAVLAALLIKFSLFALAALGTSESVFRADPDSADYLKTASMLASSGRFAEYAADGSLRYERCRTPGYPFFLAVLNGCLKIPLTGVIALQVFLTILGALVIYQTALQIDPKIAFLSMILILFDLPIAVFSMMFMTETLYLIFVCLFLFAFTRYLKTRRAMEVIGAAALLAAATYVRPISYYFGAAAAAFIFYANCRAKPRQAALHALMFAFVTYGILGLWQWRNYLRFSEYIFSGIAGQNLTYHSLFQSYASCTDPSARAMGPVRYYLDVGWRCFLSLMTRPGSLKYFHSPALSLAGKIFGYPWMIFWMTGFLAGILMVKRNLYYQFVLLCAVYFILVSVCGAGWCAGERFRVPIMPFIAVLSAHGWSRLRGGKSSRLK
jgi:hypothetical protein